MMVLLIACVLSLWSTHKMLPFFGREDPPQIVIDELAGLGVPLLLAGPTWPEITAAFVFFRIFDIFKPWPISYLDRNVKGSWGVLLDDLVAGMAALAVLQATKAFI
jgi:phosphatidylglycerophosphatase A